MASDNDVMGVVETLWKKGPFVQHTVEALTRVELYPVKAESTPYFRVLRGTASVSVQTPFAEVELRLPTPEHDAKDGLLILSLKKDAGCVEQGTVTAKYGPGVPEMPTPRQPVDTPIYLGYTQPRGEISFAFPRQGSTCLVKVVMDAI